MLNGVPSNLVISFGSSSTATIAIPQAPAGTPISYSQAMQNIFLAGGFWYTVAGVPTFVPYSEITSATAT
jgi:hypothetical protein